MQKFSYNSYAPFCEPGSPHFLVSLPLVVWGNVTVTGLELLPQNGLLNILGARQRPFQSCGLERGTDPNPQPQVPFTDGANGVVLGGPACSRAPWKVGQKHASCPHLSWPDKIMACDTRGHLYGERWPNWNSYAIKNLKMLPHTCKKGKILLPWCV